MIPVTLARSNLPGTSGRLSSRPQAVAWPLRSPKPLLGTASSITRSVRKAPCHQDDQIEKLDRDIVQKATNRPAVAAPPARSEEHTSELQSLMRISYAVFCLKKK